MKARKAWWARRLMVDFLIRALREKDIAKQMKIIAWLAKGD
jgi:hypothetical protein